MVGCQDAWLPGTSCAIIAWSGTRKTGTVSANVPGNFSMTSVGSEALQMAGCRNYCLALCAMCEYTHGSFFCFRREGALPLLSHRFLFASVSKPLVDLPSNMSFLMHPYVRAVPLCMSG